MVKYKDLNTSFRDNYDNNVVVKDLDSIKKNLERLFHTKKGDVPFNRDYGTSLYELLFENNLTATDITMFLYMDITTFEPRVTLSPADITIDRLDNNTFRINCYFTVPSLNNTPGSLTTDISSN